MPNHRISREKRALILHLLVEGNRINGICRLLKVGKPSLLRFLRECGEACEDWHDRHVRDVRIKYLALDESWSYIFKHKERMSEEEKLWHPDWGDSWVWVAIDRFSKALISWLVADRKQPSCVQFCADLAQRVEGDVTVATDALSSYEWGIDSTLGSRASHVIEMKDYDNIGTKPEEGDNPADHVSTTKRRARTGKPNLKLATTSHIERLFLTVRQDNKRCARKTQANSKKIENHQAVMSVHLFVYNVCRKHESIKTAPLHELGIIDKPWSLEQVVGMTDQYLRTREEAEFEAAFNGKPQESVSRFAKWKPRIGPRTYKPRKPLTPWYLDPESGGPNPPHELRKPGIQYDDGNVRFDAHDETPDYDPDDDSLGPRIGDWEGGL